MPYVIITNYYPSHRQKDMIKRYLDVAGKVKVDESLGKQLCAPVTTMENGIRVMNIWETTEENLGKLLAIAAKFYYDMCVDLENAEYTIKVWYTFEEAAGIAQMKIPE
ncbi:MAG: hypothetical protein ACTSQI_21200 [Candidatus Helarchaeota archaeon]